MGEISRYIDLKGMNNTRDLGGMLTKDGRRIKANKLIRSGRLRDLRDRAWFTENVGLVVDLRTTWEVGEEADPVISGVENLHLPIFEMPEAGVTREKETEQKFGPPEDPAVAMEQMAAVYLRFVTTDFSLGQYRRFMRLVLEPRDKALLWHCTAGKDRTGIASLFIEAALGVDWDDIMADYLATNTYLEEETRSHMEMRERQLGRPMTEAEEKATRYFFGACEEYPRSVRDKAVELYGSFDAFIRDGLCISDAEREKLKELYLEG